MGSKLKNTTTIDKLEMPLRFLRQNEDRRLKHLSLGHEAYLRNLTMALLESMVVKDKLVRNYQDSFSTHKNKSSWYAYVKKTHKITRLTVTGYNLSLHC